MMIIKKKVSSSWISRVDRLPNKGMRVLFDNGTYKDFKNVSDVKFKDFVNAESKGKFFNYAIKGNSRHEITA